MKKKNILVIVAHRDDETFGCGGTISKYIKQNWKVLPIYDMLSKAGEVVVEWIWEKLKPELESLSRLVLWENETSRVEYSGD